MKHISIIPGRIEFAIHVHMNGDVKNIRVGIKSFLAAVSFVCE